MIHQCRIQKRLRGNLIYHIAVFGTHDDLTRQLFQVATQNQGVMREQTRQTLRQLGGTHVDIIQLLQLVAFAIFRRAVQRCVRRSRDILRYGKDAKRR